MRRRRAILWWAIPALLMVVGGVVAVVKSRPPQAVSCCAESAGGSHAVNCPHGAGAASGQLPPGHPDISGMMPQAKPLTPDQAAAGECPFMKKQGAAKAPQT